MGSERRTALSSVVAERAADALDSGRRPQQLAADLQVTNPPDTRMLRFSYTAHSPRPPRARRQCLRRRLPRQPRAGRRGARGEHGRLLREAARSAAEGARPARRGDRLLRPGGRARRHALRALLRRQPHRRTQRQHQRPARRGHHPGPRRHRGRSARRARRSRTAAAARPRCRRRCRPRPARRLGTARLRPRRPHPRRRGARPARAGTGHPAAPARAPPREAGRAPCARSRPLLAGGRLAEEYRSVAFRLAYDETFARRRRVLVVPAARRHRHRAGRLREPGRLLRRDGQGGAAPGGRSAHPLAHRAAAARGRPPARLGPGARPRHHRLARRVPRPDRRGRVGRLRPGARTPRQQGAARAHLLGRQPAHRARRRQRLRAAGARARRAVVRRRHRAHRPGRLRSARLRPARGAARRPGPGAGAGRRRGRLRARCPPALRGHRRRLRARRCVRPRLAAGPGPAAAPPHPAEFVREGVGLRVLDR